MDERKPREGHQRRRRKPVPGWRADDDRPSGASERQRPRTAPVRRIHWSRHGIEFLVIIAGIMVSFLLNEWRQERMDRREERRLLEDLKVDLRQDSVLMADELRQVEEVLDLGRRLFEHPTRPLPLDSVTHHLSPAISYIAIPFHQASYMSMRYTRSASLIQDRELLRDLVELHESRYFMMREIFGIDRSQVLERLFPITERHVMITEATPADLDRMMADPEWRNLTIHSLMFKRQIADMFLEELAHGDSLMRRIEAALAE